MNNILQGVNNLSTNQKISDPYELLNSLKRENVGYLAVNLPLFSEINEVEKEYFKKLLDSGENNYDIIDLRANFYKELRKTTKYLNSEELKNNYLMSLEQHEGMVDYLKTNYNSLIEKGDLEGVTFEKYLAANRSVDLFRLSERIEFYKKAIELGDKIQEKEVYVRGVQETKNEKNVPSKKPTSNTKRTSMQR